MNRTTAILVALATLLAHILAIHQNTDGVFGPPYEVAHVAYRVSRNLVFEGTPAWSTAGSVLESYPSPLWVLICAVATRLYFSVTLASQYLGIACSLVTVIVLAQFAADRRAGLIALLLLVVTGTTASAATSGTEMPLVMLLVTAAFLAYERRRARIFSALLVLLTLTRPDVWLLVAALAVLELRRRRRLSADESSLLRAFIAPAALAVVLVLVRGIVTGSWLSTVTADLLRPDAERYRLGLDYLTSFFLRSGGATLVIFPTLYLLRGRLSGTGRRALALVVVWSLFVLQVGGDGLPFWMSMAPIVPLLFLSVQEAMILAMDSRRPGLGPLTWVLLIAGIGASALVSRVPADVGAIPIGQVQRAWMKPSESYRRTYGRFYGRLGLMQEIRTVERLRSCAVFLREHLEPGSTVMTSWPGAIGYISRVEVVDLLGRTTPPRDGSRQRSWYGTPRVDLAAVLAEGVDYIVPSGFTGSRPPRGREIAEAWVARFDDTGDPEGAIAALLEELRRYEIISVPVPERAYRPAEIADQPFYLLRDKELGLQPHLELRLDDGGISVLARQSGHNLVADLEVAFTEPDGTRWMLRPTGEFAQEELVHARTGLLLYSTGQRPVCLMRFELPPELARGEVSAVLQNPSTERDPEFWNVSETVTLTIGG